jgi:hypothetical protein
VTIKDAGGSSATASSTAYVGGPATQFSVSAATTAVTAGTPFAVTVTALDANLNRAYSYTGTVQFASTDPRPFLPANYSFTPGDLGLHVFTVKLVTVGTQSVTATDTVNAKLTGKQGGIVVSPAALSQFQVVPSTGSATPGASFKLKVTAEDAYGNLIKSYRGTVHFTSSDRQAPLPADTTFVSYDQGTHTFIGVTLETAGNQTVTVTDTSNGAVTGTSAPVLVSPPAFAIVNPQSQFTQTTATITWQTPVAATSQIFYSLAQSGPWLAGPSSQSLVTPHSLVLTGLQPGTLYYFWVESFDQFGDEGHSTILTFGTIR